MINRRLPRFACARSLFKHNRLHVCSPAWVQNLLEITPPFRRNCARVQPHPALCNDSPFLGLDLLDKTPAAVFNAHFIWKMNNLRAEAGSNPSFWDSPVTRSTYETVVANLGKDNDAVMQALKDMAPHVLENAWGIWLPAANAFHMWQPWVQNYHGESNTGSSTIFHQERIYIWMDEELKASLGY